MQTLASLTPRGGKPGVEIQGDATAAPSSDDLPKLDAVGATVQKWLDFNTFRHDLPESSRTTPAWHLGGLGGCFALFGRRVRSASSLEPCLDAAAGDGRDAESASSETGAGGKFGHGPVRRIGCRSRNRSKSSARRRGSKWPPMRRSPIPRLKDFSIDRQQRIPTSRPLHRSPTMRRGKRKPTPAGCSRQSRKIHDERERNRPIPDSPKDSPPSGPNG